MTYKPRLLFTFLVATTVLPGGTLPAYAKGNDCSFQVKGLSMNFGELNPGSGVNAIAQVSGASTAGDCAPGHTMVIAGDNGLNYNGSRNLKNVAGNLIPYSFISLPQSQSGPGNSDYVPFTFSGVVQWSGYANASAGLYFDTVIISVTP